MNASTDDGISVYGNLAYQSITSRREFWQRRIYQSISKASTDQTVLRISVNIEVPIN